LSKTAHHVFTYCNAVHQGLKRIGSDLDLGGHVVEPVRAILHGATAIYLIRYLNVPPARLPGEGDDRLEGLPSTVEDIRVSLLDAFDRQHHYLARFTLAAACSRNCEVESAPAPAHRIPKTGSIKVSKRCGGSFPAAIYLDSTLFHLITALCGFRTFQSNVPIAEMRQRRSRAGAPNSIVRATKLNCRPRRVLADG
jgi:hypothetical protein